MFSTKKFSKGEFLLEYKGELVSEDEGYQREESYGAELGSFLFFFKDGSKSLWYKIILNYYNTEELDTNSNPEEKAIKSCWGFKIVGLSLRTIAHNSTLSMSII